MSGRLYYYLLAAILFFCYPGKLFGQSDFTPVAGLPTNEVFDLLVDRKGYLWVGHDMGISRYDGVTFTHFAHPQRSSLSCTDLVEDPQGRIWFHNFTGQIFYIENERINLLSEYDNEKEESFPRMGLLGSEIVVTSRKGLFVCDTRTMRSRYELVPGDESSGPESIAVIGDKVLGHRIDQWFLYQPRKGIRKVFFKGMPEVLVENRKLVLQPKGIGDTALMLGNPSGSVYRLIWNNEVLDLVGSQHVSSFINAVNHYDGLTWVHAKANSTAFSGSTVKKKIQGLDISDMAIDKQGNTWISTLSHGLRVAENNASFTLLRPAFTAGGHTLTALHSDKNGLFAGTRKGKLFWLHAAGLEVHWQYQFADDVGSINLIQPIAENKYLISTSVGSFSLNIQDKTVHPYFAFISKDVVAQANHLVIASSAGLFSFPQLQDSRDTMNRVVATSIEWNEWWKKISHAPVSKTDHRYYWYAARTRSVAKTRDNRLYVSFMNGVHVFGPDGMRPLLLNGAKVYSNSLQAVGNKLFVGSLNKGLLILDGDDIKSINTGSGLFSNSIIRIKVTHKYLWIILDRGIQLLDLDTERIINDVEIPQEMGSNVFDVVLQQDTALMSTSNGIYRIAMQPSKNYEQLNSELKLVVVKNKDSIGQAMEHQLAASPADLKHWQNDIQFHLSVPWYNPANNLYFKYRLIGSNTEGQWYTTQANERIISFASLMPGTYTFESYAVVAGFQEKNPVRFQFTIARPWWRTNLFTLGMVVLVGLLFFALYRFRMAQVLRLDQVRRSISSDLHDEIGSTISSINIYSELAKSEKDNEPYLTLIQENTREVITKLDDLVWSINPKNDSMEQLVARMRLFAEPVLAGAGIQVQFQVDTGVPVLELSLPRKRNLYLMFKELINNVVKHSRAKTCLVEISLNNNRLKLVVKDDGIGINAAQVPLGRSGMQNLKERATNAKASFEIGAIAGGGTLVTVQMPLK